MGIITLYPSNSDDIDLNLSLNLDIIALHGLNGNAERTWTHPTTKSLWLRDFLPLDMPRARVMVFSYNAKAAFENCTAGIIEHARDLLRCLIEKREGVNEQIRPLVILGHSLGGLVLKQALLVASQQDRYRDIIKAIRMTIFLGTPHGGSNAADYGAILARVPTALAMKGSPVLLESLRKGNAPLQKLTKDFRKLLRERECLGEEKEIEVVSFYETKPIGLLLVVERDSALLTPKGERVTYEEQIPVAANHRDICRFSSSEDSTYISIVKRIKSAHKKTLGIGRKEVKNEHFLVPNDLNPHFTGRNDIRRKLIESLLDKDFAGEKKQKRFVLHGLGGSGKTQLVLKFAKDYRSRYWGAFFLDASSTANLEAGFMKIAEACRRNANVEEVRTWLSKKDNWLLIIDNADDPTLEIEKFFPPGQNGTILMTTRNLNFRDHATVGSCKVDEMSVDDSVALLLRTSGLIEEAGAQKKIAENVVETLGHLALAVVQAGAVIRQNLVSLNGFCDLYSKRKKELLESGRQNSKTNDQRSVYTTWEISIRMIHEIKEKHAELALEFLRHFAFMHFDYIDAGFFHVAVEAANMCDDMSVAFQEHAKTKIWHLMPSGKWDEILVAKALALLASFSLITIDDNRISIHPLVHEWSRERMSTKEHKQSWNSTVITLSMATCWRYNKGDLRNRKMLMPHIYACLLIDFDAMWEDGPDIENRIVAGLRFALAYRESGRSQALALSQRALECSQRLDHSDPSLCLIAAKEVATALTMLGKFEEAVTVQKMVVKGESALDNLDPANIVLALNRLAELYVQMGEYETAIRTCKETINCHEGILGEDNLRMWECLETMGLAMWRSGNRKEAVKYCEKALEFRNAQPQNDDTELIEPVRRLATIYLELKRYKKARDMQLKCIALMQEAYGPDDVQVAIEIARLEHFRNSIHIYLGRSKGIVTTKDMIQKSLINDKEINMKTLEGMEHLAWDYYLGGSLEKARLLQEEVVKAKTEKWGKDHISTVDSVKTLNRIQKCILGRKAFYWWVPKKFLEKEWLHMKRQD